MAKFKLNTVKSLYQNQDYKTAFSEAQSHEFERYFSPFVYVKALYHYNPFEDAGCFNQSAGLTFFEGDVLQVAVKEHASADGLPPAEYASAVVVYPEEHQGTSGLVPSPISKLTNRDLYQKVKSEPPGYMRPVLILSSMKAAIQSAVYDRFPARYASCTPHTSRPRREGEVPGYDYHFVKRETMLALYNQGAFVEMGEYHGNLYGTTEGSVREICQRRKRHCLLESGNSIARLKAVKVYPIVILVKPNNAEQIRQWEPTLTLGDAYDRHQKDCNLEEQFGHHVTAVINAPSIDELAAMVEECVKSQSKTSVWIIDDSGYDG